MIDSSNNCTWFNFNAPLRVVSIEWKPWITIEGHGDNISVKGVLVKLLDTLSVSLNFSYRFVDARGTKWCPDDVYMCIDPLLKMINENGADIALFNFVPTDERKKIVAFPGIFYIDHGALLLGMKDETIIKYHDIFLWEVWFILAFLFLFCACFYYSICRLFQRQCNRRINRFIDILWNFLAPMLNQGIYLESFSFATKGIVALWSLTALFFLCCFNGLIISSITKKVSHTSLEDLTKDNNLQPLVPLYSIVEGHFRESKHPVLKILADRLKAVPDSYVLNHLIHEDIVLDKVEFGNKVLFTFYSEILNAMAERFSRKKKCDFILSENRHFPRILSYAVGKHLPKCFIDALEWKTNMIYINRLLDHWLMEYTANHTKCLSQRKPSIHSLSLMDTSTIFMWWVKGLTAASVFLLFEILWVKIQKYVNS